jgi:hypothetical protein
MLWGREVVGKWRMEATFSECEQWIEPNANHSFLYTSFWLRATAVEGNHIKEGGLGE